MDGDNDVEQQAVDDNQDPDYVHSEESGDQAEVRDGDEVEGGDQVEDGDLVEDGDQVEGGDLARKVYCGRQTRRGATKKHMQGVSVKKSVNMTLEIIAWTIRTLDNVNIAKAIMLTNYERLHVTQRENI